MKEACSGMASPDAGAWKRVKRIARCIQDMPTVVLQSGAEPNGGKVVCAFGHADWIGRRRIHTSSGIMTAASKSRASSSVRLGLCD